MSERPDIGDYFVCLSMQIRAHGETLTLRDCLAVGLELESDGLPLDLMPFSVRQAVRIFSLPKKS